MSARARPDKFIESLTSRAETLLPATPAVARIDAEIARELMTEVAEMLHNGLVLDHLDEHDHAIAVSLLAADLTEPDPTVAVRARAASVAEDPTLHDPEGVRCAYLIVIQLLGL